MNDGKALTLQPSRLRWLMVLAMCLGFAAIAVLMVLDGRGVGWFVGSVFGFGAAFALASLCPGASFLKLEPDCFVLRTLGRERRYSWTDVGTFHIRKFDLLGRFVSFAIVREERETWAMLPDSYGMKLDHLSDLMNAWRERAVLGVIESWAGRVPD